jgi:NAD-dependent DNA ligase
MPSTRVTQILLSKTDLAPEKISGLSEAQAWRLVYAIPRPRRDDRPEVCFTGFRAAEKAELAERASLHNLKVVTAVTKNLSILVCGLNAGPSKLEKAAAQGVTLLDSSEFDRFLATGEVP